MMEIKWWDKEKNEYDEQEVYYLDEEMNVCIFESRYYENYMDCVFNIEPHFYLKGVRVRYDD